LSAQGGDGLKNLFAATDKLHAQSELPGQESNKDDVDSFNENTPLLGSSSMSDLSFYRSKLQSLVKKIAAALTALLTTIGAPVVYVVNQFRDEQGHYTPLRPIKSLRPFFSRQRSTNSTATAVGLSSFAKEKSGTTTDDSLSKRSAYTAKLRSSASNDSLTSNTSESEGEKSQAIRPRRAEKVTARRSIRIQDSKTESIKQRKQKRRTVTGHEPLTLDTIKSPLSASQSLMKIHKYPHAPAPPRPLIPRRQPSYSNLIPRSPNPRPPPRHQKTLILDLDETLIHSLAKGGRMSSGHMVEVKLNAPIGPSAASPHSPLLGPQHPILYYVHKRPHCDEFLRKVCQWYKLVVFTASVQEYADPVVDWLEQERKFFLRRCYRQHCTFRNGAYIKDLSSVEPDLSRVAILDNSPMSYIFHEGGFFFVLLVDDSCGGGGGGGEDG